MIGSCVPDTSLGRRMVEREINSKHEKEREENKAKSKRTQSTDYVTSVSETLVL